MDQGHRQALTSIVTLLVVMAALWALYAGMARLITQAAREADPAVRYKTAAPTGKGHAYSDREVREFLHAARDAEDITDPLQRCLAIPDPPGSHWNRAAVEAYCRYRNQPVISLAQARDLIESGHATRLDAMLAQALHEQLTDPDASGRLDRTYVSTFENGDFEIRPLLDAWKRQSPNSAFAYAASGVAYKRMAFNARGGAWIVDTPGHKLASMDRLAVLADADLQRAVQLDSRVVPAYAAMIGLGGATLGRGYGLAAARRGLAIDPGNMLLYDQLLWLEEPKWGGSIAAMERVSREIRAKARRYPLLDLELREIGLYRLANCNCTPTQKLVAYSGIVDQLIGRTTLSNAGDIARDAGDDPAAVIYYTEALRFDPGNDAVRINRADLLTGFHHMDWAVEESTEILARSPDDRVALKVRGWAYLNMYDAPRAVHDFEAAARLDPRDVWTLRQLGDAYVGEGKFDKAWTIADRLMAEEPQHADGWIVRALVQLNQPRPGLDDTLAYLDAHFAKDADMARYIAELRAAAVQRDARPASAHTAGVAVPASSG